MLMGVCCTVDSRFSAVTTISSSPESFGCAADCADAERMPANGASAMDKHRIALILPVTSSPSRYVRPVAVATHLSVSPQRLAPPPQCLRRLFSENLLIIAGKAPEMGKAPPLSDHGHIVGFTTFEQFLAGSLHTDRAEAGFRRGALEPPESLVERAAAHARQLRHIRDRDALASVGHHVLICFYDVLGANRLVGRL